MELLGLVFKSEAAMLEEVVSCNTCLNSNHLHSVILDIVKKMTILFEKEKNFGRKGENPLPSMFFKGLTLGFLKT